MISVMKKMSKDGLLTENPPENVPGSDILHEFFQGKIDT